jgi:hypothetical protein
MKARVHLMRPRCNIWGDIKIYIDTDRKWGLDWSQVPQCTVQWRAGLNTIMDCVGSSNPGDLKRWVISRFPGRLCTVLELLLLLLLSMHLLPGTPLCDGFI